MKINKIRTIAILYPYESLEAQIEINDELYYLNFQFDYDFDDAIGENWIYTKPLDEIKGDPNDDSAYIFSREEEKIIITQMIDFFKTKMNGEWDYTNQWHDII